MIKESDLGVALPGTTGVCVRYRYRAREAAVIRIGNVFTFTMPDDWMSLDDLQALADYVDAERLLVKRLVVRHELRRVLIKLTETLQGGYSGFTEFVTIDADRDVPPRTIRMET